MGTAVSDGLSSSEYSSLQSKISSLRSSVETAGSQMNSTAESSYNGLDSVKFGSWADDVASNLNNYCTAVKEGMREIGTDYAGGNFINLKLSLTDLETALGQCAKYASNIATQKTKYNSAKSETKKARILELINAETRNLSTCVAFCNDRIAFAEGVVFNGTATYTPGGVSGLEDTSTLSSEIDGMGDDDIQSKLAQASSGSPSTWQRETVFTTSNDKTVAYVATVDGQRISFSTTKDGQVLHYDVVIDGEVHFYDASGKEITSQERQTIRDNYNNSH